MRTIQEFSEKRPSEYGAHILVFVTLGYQVTGINIETRDKGFNNLINSLSNLISVTTNILGSTVTIIPLSSKNKGGYWHFTVEPFSLQSSPESLVTSSFNDTDGANLYINKVARFNPEPDNANFSKSNFVALLNNSENSVSSNNIYEVDRLTSNINPSNLSSILSGSATKAAFPISNHSQQGLLNSRYEGAKTSIIDFGVNSAIKATTINASIYISSSTNDFICSQSDNLRSIEPYLFEGSAEYPSSGSRIFNTVGNQVIPIRNKKVWVESTRNIIYMNQDGYAIDDGITCLT